MIFRLQHRNFLGPTIFNVPSGVNAELFAPPTQHFTIVFNSFVMMTLFNEINCRKVHGERNVFKNLSSNRMFIVIWISTFIAQICIVQFGGAWFSTASLSWSQWLVCLLLGLSELVYGQVVATIPSKRILPKHWAHGSGEAKASKLKNERGNRFGTVQKRQNTKGYSLWMRGVELIGLHVRLYFQLRKKICGFLVSCN